MDQLFRGALSARFIFRASLALIVLTTGLLGYVFYVANSFEQPVQGGTFREGIVGSIATINPLFAQLNPAEEDITRLVYSGLTKYDPKQQKTVADLATFQVSNDYKEYVFQIHPDARWHDGEQVTADDVVFTYKVIQDSAFPNALLKSAFTDVKVSKVDDRTVQFILPTSYSFFPTATTLGILPEHIWKDVPIEGMSTDPLGMRPVGSGPFKIEGALAPSTSGEQLVTMVRNDEYYGDTPYLDRIILQFYPTFEDLLAKQTSLLAMKSIPPELVEDVRALPRFDVFEIDEPRYYAAIMNVENETLQDKKAREGLSMAINREELLSPYPYLDTINAPFPTDVKDPWKFEYYPDRAQGSLFDAGWKFPTGEQVDTYKKGLWTRYLSGTVMKEQSGSGTTLEAQPVNSSGTTMQEPKYGTGTVLTDDVLASTTLEGKRLLDLVDIYKDTRVNAKGAPMKLRVATLESSSYLVEIADRLAESWDKVGVDAQVIGYSSEELLTIIKNREYDVIVIGQDLGYDGDIFPYWHSSAAKLSGRNLANFKSNTLDGLLEAMRKPAGSLNEEDLYKQREEQKQKIGTLLQEELPAIFLFQRKNYFAVDKKIKNVYIQNLITPKDRFAYAETWYEASGKQLRLEVTPQAFFHWLGQMLSS